MSRLVILVPAPRLVQAGLLKSLAWTAPVKMSWVSTLMVITPALHVAGTLGANTASTPGPLSLLVSVSGPGIVANSNKMKAEIVEKMMIEWLNRFQHVNMQNLNYASPGI